MVEEKGHAYMVKEARGIYSSASYEVNDKREIQNTQLRLTGMRKTIEQKKSNKSQIRVGQFIKCDEIQTLNQIINQLINQIITKYNQITNQIIDHIMDGINYQITDQTTVKQKSNDSQIYLLTFT